MLRLREHDSTEESGFPRPVSRSGRDRHHGSVGIISSIISDSEFTILCCKAAKLCGTIRIRPSSSGPQAMPDVTALSAVMSEIDTLIAYLGAAPDALLQASFSEIGNHTRRRKDRLLDGCPSRRGRAGHFISYQQSRGCPAFARHDGWAPGPPVRHPSRLPVSHAGHRNSQDKSAIRSVRIPGKSVEPTVSAEPHADALKVGKRI